MSKRKSKSESLKKQAPHFESIEQLSPADRAEFRALDKQLDALDIHDPEFHSKLIDIIERKHAIKDAWQVATALRAADAESSAASAPKDGER